MSLASAFVDAHRTGVPVSASSMAVPDSFRSAELVQVEVAERLSAEIAGWKVGMAPDGETAVAAPIFEHLLLADGAAYSRGEATFIAVEVEIGFRIDANAALGAAFIGVEVVRSRFVEGPKAPFLSFLADNIVNGAYAIGSERVAWRGLDLAKLPCRVWKDDRMMHDAIGGHPQGDPRAPLRVLASRPVDRLGSLRAGQFVTTGTLCGVMRMDRACTVRAEVEGLGVVSIRIID